MSLNDSVWRLAGLCGSKFTFFNRRHHCRACNRSICGTHSQQKTALAGFREPQRVCDDCSASIIAEREKAGQRHGELLLYHTHSICVQCSLVERKGFAWHASRVVEYRGAIWLVLRCPSHGAYWTKLSSDTAQFHKAVKMATFSPWSLSLIHI